MGSSNACWWIPKLRRVFIATKKCRRESILKPYLPLIFRQSCPIHIAGNCIYCIRKHYLYQISVFIKGPLLAQDPLTPLRVKLACQDTCTQVLGWAAAMPAQWQSLASKRRGAMRSPKGLFNESLSQWLLIVIQYVLPRILSKVVHVGSTQE